jgi:aspartyl-tRNA(Asn)/glutamyl-tRNA(Gln) amidotransferase subunit A
LAAVKSWDPPTFAVVTSLAEPALRRAEDLDREAAQGNWRGPLHGIPITVKDVIHMAGAPTYAGSAAYHARPENDAASVARLRRAGAVILAKVSTHELALGVTNPQSRHPADPTRIPGGSSGGSAISVATGMALGSVGTDTRASTRVPAALCGVVGLKPTFDLISAEGIVQLSWTMDHIGALAASAADGAALVEAMAEAPVSLLAGISGEVSDWRVGVPVAGFEGADPQVTHAVRAALGALRARGVRLIEVEQPDARAFALANSAGLLISRCEALAYHRSLGTDFAQLWPETADQLAAAARVTTEEYLAAQRLRAELGIALLRMMDDLALDALAMPASLVTAPLVSDAERFITTLSRNAIPWSLLGWPAISVPSPVPAGALPVGLQIVAPPYEDAAVVRLAAAVESRR